MPSSQRSPHRDNERRALLGLAHPIAVGALGLWIVNDHLLKARFGSPITGKLSDVAGLIVFPLILAAVLSWWTKRPLTFALAATAVLFASINLFATADVAMEWAMNLFLRSELTQDPTDLVLLPVLLVPWQLWRAAAARPTQLRTTWSHAILGLGLATTLATSSAGEQSETFTGTMLLDEAQPRVEIPIELTLNGEPASAEEPVSVSTAATFFGTGEGKQAEALKATVVDRGDDGDAVVLELTDPSWGPVEVRWSITAYTDGEVGNLLNPFDNGNEAAQPVLIVDAPADTFGPEPLVVSDPLTGNRSPVRFSIVEFVVTTTTMSPELLVGSLAASRNSDSLITVANDDVISPSATTVRVNPPSSCSAVPCTFSLWVRSPRQINALELYGADGVTATVTEHELLPARETFPLGPIMIDGRTSVEAFVTVAVDSRSQTPVERLTSFLQPALHISPNFDLSATDSAGYDPCCKPSYAQPVTTNACCEWRLNAGVGKDGHEGLAEVDAHVDFYSLQPDKVPNLSVELSDLTAEPQ